MNDSAKYEMVEEYRDVGTVAEALGLEGEPLKVDMIGRNIIFMHPKPAGGGNNE